MGYTHKTIDPLIFFFNQTMDFYISLDAVWHEKSIFEN